MNQVIFGLLQCGGTIRRTGRLKKKSEKAFRFIWDRIMWENSYHDDSCFCYV